MPDPVAATSPRVVVVTGATEGIGWATARRFAAEGCTVVVNGRVDDDRLAERVATLEREFGVAAHGIAADAAVPGEVAELYRRVHADLQRLDVLISNAGVLGDAVIGMISDSLLDRTLAVNLAGSIRHLQAAARLMGRAGGGSIVLLSSIMATQGAPGQVAYGAAKAGVIGAARSAARELGPKGIRVNVVAPGYIGTRMVAAVPPDVHQARLASIALGRMGTPEEVASVIAFLASDAAAYVTGQVLGVDGGLAL